MKGEDNDYRASRGEAAQTYDRPRVPINTGGWEGTEFTNPPLRSSQWHYSFVRRYADTREEEASHLPRLAISEKSSCLHCHPPSLNPVTDTMRVQKSKPTLFIPSPTKPRLGKNNHAIFGHKTHRPPPERSGMVRTNLALEGLGKEMPEVTGRRSFSTSYGLNIYLQDESNGWRRREDFGRVAGDIEVYDQIVCITVSIISCPSSDGRDNV